MIDVHLEFSLDRSGAGRKLRRFFYVPRSRRRELGLDDNNLARAWFLGLHARCAWAFGKGAAR